MFFVNNVEPIYYDYKKYKQTNFNNSSNIIPFKKNNVFPIKINKSIEIVIVPNFGEVNSHQDNVGIILEEKKFLKILSKRYKNVLITELILKKI